MDVHNGPELNAFLREDGCQCLDHGSDSLRDGLSVNPVEPSIWKNGRVSAAAFIEFLQ
jgi:hypothetical protein